MTAKKKAAKKKPAAKKKTTKKKVAKKKTAARKKRSSTNKKKKVARRSSGPAGAGAQSPAPVGRPCAYTPEIGEAICRRLAEGQSLTSVCDDPELPSRASVIRWLLAQETKVEPDAQGGDREVVVPKYPEFRNNYELARKIGYMLMADELVDIVDDARNDWIEREIRKGIFIPMVNQEAISRSRLRADKRQWILAKMLPKIYGDKLEHTGHVEHEQKGTVEHLHRSADQIPFDKIMEKAKQEETLH